MAFYVISNIISFNITYILRVTVHIYISILDTARQTKL
jgi:hypothetical protein